MQWHKRPKKEFNPKKHLGKIHVYTGDGKGKTSAALGVLLRAAGQNMKVSMVQLFKGHKDAGELMAQQLLGPDIEIVQFGTTDPVDLENPAAMDLYIAGRALDYARDNMRQNRPDILILDEFNPALAHGIVDLKEFLEFLDNKHHNTEVIITGHSAPSEILNAADLVTVMRATKGAVDDWDAFEPRMGVEH